MDEFRRADQIGQTLTHRLRALARYEHDDVSIGDEAADALIALEMAEAEAIALVVSHEGKIEALQLSRDRAVRLLHLAMAQLRRWGEAYGTHTPPWLPPGGDLRLAEDVDEFLRPNV